MSYNDYERSSSRGQPIELLEIQYGPTDEETTRTTSGDMDVVVGGHTYTAFACTRDDFDDEGDPDDAKQMSIRVPRDHPFIKLFDEREFPRLVAVRIKRMHLDDPDLGTFNLWSGRLVGVSYEPPSMVLGCEKVSTTLSWPGCRVRYLRQCRHTLYMPGCWVDKAQYKSQVYPNNLNAQKTKFAIMGSGVQMNRFIGGIFEYEGNTRFVVNVEWVAGFQTSTITLNRPLLTLPDAGQPWSPAFLYPGCDRTAKTCLAQFQNLDNYGGFDYIPPKGPFEGSSIV